MMTGDYFAFVGSAYGISAVVLAALIGWIVLDARGRRREMAALEKTGLRRRSGRGEGA